MTRRARLAARLLRLDDVPIVIEVDADAGGRLRAHRRKLGMAGQAAKRVAARAFAIVNRRHRELAAAMIDMTGRALERGRAVGQPAVAAAHQHVRPSAACDRIRTDRDTVRSAATRPAIPPCGTARISDRSARDAPTRRRATRPRAGRRGTAAWNPRTTSAADSKPIATSRRLRFG